ETLLVRLMVAGPLLSQAVEDLRALPDDAHERGVADQILVNLQHVLRDKPSRTPEEQEFIMRMLKTWADARKEGRDEGRAEGRDEGRAEEGARALLTTLRVRGIAVPEAVRRRILTQKDPEKLARWLEKDIVATSISEVMRAP